MRHLSLDLRLWSCTVSSTSGPDIAQPLVQEGGGQPFGVLPQAHSVSAASEFRSCAAPIVAA